jgi:hypothetical protein
MRKVSEQFINNIFLLSDNMEENSFKYNFLINNLIEIKFLIDQYNQVPTDFLFNSIHKDYIRKNLQILSIGTDFDRIWSCDVHYLDFIPKDKGILLAMVDERTFQISAEKSVVIFPFKQNIVKYG